MATGLPPDLTEANHEWVLDFSSFRSAWSRTRGAGITMAHPDSGWTMHPELVEPTYVRTVGLSRNFLDPANLERIKRWPTGYPIAVNPVNPIQFLLSDLIGRDDFGGHAATGHGTGTAGVIVSPAGHPSGATPGDRAAAFPAGDPRAFVSGAAPESRVIPFRVTDNPLLLDTEDTALTNCIYFCIALRTKLDIDVGVMSISLGGTRFGTAKKIQDALAEARRAGIVVVAAAGQTPYGKRWARRMRPTYPGSSPDTICAAGCDSRHAPLGGAFYGQEVDITAPAVNVWVPRTLREGDVERHRVERSEGTSYATALTAAACALWQSHHGRDALIATFERHRLLTVFRYCLQKSADRPAGWDEDPDLAGKRGAGILDVDQLLSVALPSRQLAEQLDLLTPWWLRPGDWRN